MSSAHSSVIDWQFLYIYSFFLLPCHPTADKLFGAHFYPGMRLLISTRHTTAVDDAAPCRPISPEYPPIPLFTGPPALPAIHANIHGFFANSVTILSSMTHSDICTVNIIWGARTMLPNLVWYVRWPPPSIPKKEHHRQFCRTQQQKWGRFGKWYVVTRQHG